LFLRLMLGTIFIWAGLMKVQTEMEVPPEGAATLANMGVSITPPAAPAAPKPEEVKPPEPKPEAPKAPETKPEERPKDGGKAMNSPPRIVLARQAPKTYTAADFPGPVKVKPVYMLALGLYSAAHPAADPGAPARMRLWPESLGNG